MSNEKTEPRPLDSSCEGTETRVVPSGSHVEGTENFAVPTPLSEESERFQDLVTGTKAAPCEDCGRIVGHAYDCVWNVPR